MTPLMAALAAAGVELTWQRSKASARSLTGASSQACRSDERCRRLTAIPVGLITATAAVAKVGNARQFPNARALGAFVGLVPSQHSSGGKTVLGGISKRGDRYLRTLLVHGARAALRTAAQHDDRLSRALGHRAQTKTRRQHGRGGASQQARAHHLEAAQHRRGVRPPTPHHRCRRKPGPAKKVLAPARIAAADTGTESWIFFTVLQAPVRGTAKKSS